MKKCQYCSDIEEIFPHHKEENDKYHKVFLKCPFCKKDFQISSVDMDKINEKKSIPDDIEITFTDH